MIETAPFRKTLDGRGAYVFGLGLSGLSTARALIAGGCKVSAWDDDAEKRVAAAAHGIDLEDYRDGLRGFGAFIPAPGVPLVFPAPHPAVLKAREAGLDVLGDIEIFHLCRPDVKTVGITGTNGKSTTTALIAHILAKSGRNAVAAGNIGTPVLDIALPQDGIAVLEISSYQMDLCPSFRPDISVLLNFSADHLDRHGGMDGYIAAKERIFEGRGTAIIGIDDPFAAAMAERVAANGRREVTFVSGTENESAHIYFKNNALADATAGTSDEINTLPSLTGAHNRQNLAAAYAVCRTLGLSAEEILSHAKTFEGLPHRQKTVRVIKGVLYIDDSKATNAEAASKAISSYENIYLIAGGRPKDGGLDGLQPYLKRLRHVYLIGEAADDFSRWLDAYGVANTNCGTLDVAVSRAHRAAQAAQGGEQRAVLLSPACASWDQFKSYAHRGDVFTDLVNSLNEDDAA